MTPSRSVVVTGAGGFIGGRAVEALLQMGGWDVRAGLRRWSTAARIGRYPIRPIQCDLMEPRQLEEALQGTEYVIHTAVGNREVTVEGTRNLLRAAKAAGVRRVVHLSTIDVYGRLEGTIDENTPLQRTGREYGDSKIEAEEVCQEFVDLGLDVVILRPTIVYGPFSDLWTVEPAERMSSGSWSFPREACQGICNLVYVDDLVRAAVIALDAEVAPGAAYNINGPDRVTWQEYFEALNVALGYGELTPPPSRSSRVRTRLVDPFRAAVKGVYFRFEEPIMSLYKGSKLARAGMKGLQAFLQRVPSSAEYDLYSRRAYFPIDLAASELGYRPLIDLNRGAALSSQWLLHEGVAHGRG